MGRGTSARPGGRASALDYRGPRPLDDQRPGRVAQLLREREALFWFKIGAMLIFGIALSFVGPALIATAAWAGGHNRGEPVNGFAWFAVSSVIVIPILFLIEWWTRGRFLESSVEASADWLAGGSLSYGMWEMRQAASSILIIEILLTAPRMTFNALGQFIRRKQLGEVPPHRAGEIVCTLHQAEGRVGLRQLVRSDESPAELCRVLRYLAFYDWIDIARDGKHVWLLSDARKTLISSGIASQ